MTDGPAGAFEFRPVLLGLAGPPRTFGSTSRGKPKVGLPTRQRQGDRLDQKFLDLQGQFQSNISLATSLAGAEPELVVVFEAMDERTDLASVATRLGFEVLVETEESLPPDADFPRLSTKEAASEVGACVHAICLTQRAVTDLLRLWAEWKGAGRLPRGYAPLADLFAHLKDVRVWGPEDRLRAVDWSSYFDGLIPDLPQDIELELWFRRSEAMRARVESELTSLIASAGGTVVSTSVVESIGYHGIKCLVPVALLRSLAGGDFDSVALVRAPNVMYLRVTGQKVVDGDTTSRDEATIDTAPASGAPVVCILDGVPIANHRLLSDRVIVHDPDDFAGDPTATVEERKHGTMIASVVAWGDRGLNEPPALRPILVRPILAPSPSTSSRVEELRQADLVPDLMWRVFRELFDGVDGAPPAGPEVVIINLSVGDPAMQFDRMISSWARSLDWLSYKYGVLVVIAAGNHPTLPFPGGASALAANSGEERVSAVNEAMVASSGDRRLLSPAEAINGVTVGSLHEDGSGTVHLGYRIDPADGLSMISPFAANGRGFRRGLKPDVVAPGGRVLYLENPGGATSDELVVAAVTATGPGIRAAGPHPDREMFALGTSPAAALVTRKAAQLYEVVRQIHGGATFTRREIAVAVKALLLHSARHPDGLTSPEPSEKFLGHGVIQRDLSAGCLAHEVVVLFRGSLRANQEQDLELPLPDGLQVRGAKRVTATLAWLSPVNWRHRQYRQASLVFATPTGFSNLGKPIDIGAVDAKRGTVQHLVWEIPRAVAGGRGNTVKLTVKCLEQAGGLDGDAIDYAVAVSLWVAPELGIDVYTQVRDQLQVQVPVQP